MYNGFIHVGDNYHICKIYTPLFSCDGYCGEIIDHHLVGRGYAVTESQSFNPEEIFDLCNWMHTSDEKPNNLYSDIETIGHGLVIEDFDGNFWLALSVGWFNGTKEQIENKILSFNSDAYWE